MGKSHGAHHTKFRQEMLQRDNPGDSLQISSAKSAFIECMFLPHRQLAGHCIRDISLIWLIITQCRSVFMSTKLILSRVHVPPAHSGQHDAVLSMTLCAVWCKLTSYCSNLQSAPVAAGHLKSDNTRMTTESRKPGVFIKTAHHENNNDNKNNYNNNNNN